MFKLLDFMPEGAATWADQVDWMNNFISIVSLISLVAITGVMIFFAWKYRRRGDDDQTAYITHNVTLETVWTVVPTLIVILVFYYGFVTYKEMRQPPANALEVSVTAVKWSWTFSYSNGRIESGRLTVPLGKPVRLIMTSKDVIHSLFIPAMRVKEDVYAGNYSYLWFTPIKLGEFPIFCAEYCGLQHSAMTAVLNVVSPEEYEDFLLERVEGDAPQLPPAELGAQLFKAKACHTCHSLDGSALVGPTLKNLFASGNRKFTDGSSAEVEENYVRQSVLDPNSQVVSGFTPNVMPSFEGQITDKQLSDLIAYLKTL